MSDLSASFEIANEPPGDIAALAAVWRDLERRADASFFRSWDWIAPLLANLDNAVPVEVLTVRRNAEIVGLGLLFPAQRTRHHIIHAKQLHLNATGRPEFDCLTIEYNGILTDRRFTTDASGAVLAWLTGNRPDWDEFHLAGLDAETAAVYSSVGEQLGLKAILHDRKRADSTNLVAIRSSGKDYLDSLSRNSRHQIRRSIRLYEEQGPVALTAAESVDEALDFLDGLKALHQPYWQARDKPGAFANPFFETFHRDLIRRSFAAGRVQLVRITVGDTAIGYIYNFLAGTTVYQYQSGFCYDDDPKLKPGLVSHYLAIVHNIGAGAEVYDFMAGESQHKKSLGTDTTELDWLTLQRDRLKYRLENGLRDVKHRLSAKRVA